MAKHVLTGAAAFALTACATPPLLGPPPGAAPRATIEAAPGVVETQASARTLLDADRAFAQRAAEVGPAQAYAEFMADDSVLLPTGTTPRRGGAEIAAHMADFPEGGRLEWSPQHAHLAAAGDMGVTWGRYTLVVPQGVQDRIITGSYMTVWRRDNQGRWRVALAIGNK